MRCRPFGVPETGTRRNKGVRHLCVDNSLRLSKLLASWEEPSERKRAGRCFMSSIGRTCGRRCLKRRRTTFDCSGRIGSRARPLARSNYGSFRAARSRYQGRFKSFPVQEDEHFLTVCRDAERNALRANLVSLAEDWAYGSLYHRLHKTEFAQAVLSKWPVPQPRQWRSHATNRKPSPRSSPSAAASIEAPHWGIRNGPNAP